jgi:RNA ligase
MEKNGLANLAGCGRRLLKLMVELKKQPKLYEVLDIEEYNAALDAGYIRKTKHPEHDLWILNYTDSCVWDQAWNTATLNCRGMIIDAEMNIIARGMPKFFNSDQAQAPKLELETRVRVTEKVDGSLGILYESPAGGLAIATRGSFNSEQAVWATKWLQDNPYMARRLKIIDGHTNLFEIIYPDNRVVVDYGDLEGLISLLIIDDETGKPVENYNRSVAYINVGHFMEHATWFDVIRAPERNNAEGLVVEIIETGELVKVKYSEYKRLHKFLTGATDRHIWESLRDGRNLKNEFKGAPDEFHLWVKSVAAKLNKEFSVVLARARLLHSDARAQAINSFGEEYTRKDYADIVSRITTTDSALLFMLEDDKNDALAAAIWKRLKPGGSTFKVIDSGND